MGARHRLPALASALLLWAVSTAPVGCETRDCPEQREGTVRCVGNQLERCTDGDLLYEPCAPRGLVCSEERGVCMSPEVIDGTGGGGGRAGGGDGGADGGADGPGNGGAS